MWIPLELLVVGDLFRIKRDDGTLSEIYKVTYTSGKTVDARCGSKRYISSIRDELVWRLNTE